jgi:hypothetical protein
MESKHATFVAWCAAIVGSSLAFVFPALTPVRVLWYYGLEHRWALEIRPSGFAMDWYGRSLLAVAGGVVGYVLAYLLARGVGRVSRRGMMIWLVWSAMAALLAIGTYSVQLAMRQPIPEPLPLWYSPK